MLDVYPLADIDPLSMQLAQELYDPTGRLANPEMHTLGPRFASFILDTYGVEAPEMLLPALVCDAAESGMHEGGLLERAKAFGAENLVIPSLGRVTERAQQQAAVVIEQIAGSVAPEKYTLAASDLIAQGAYAGKTRKTGAPYYNHPKQTAAMTFHIFSQLEAQGFTIEPQFKDAVVAVAVLHDATEETARSCKYYDPNRPEGFSPLLIRQVFNQTGNPHGRIAANSLRLMTHYAKQPWAPTYPEYVALGSSDFIFCLAKPCDMLHNWLIDPKPITGPENEQKIRAKQAMYQAGIVFLSITAPQRTDNPQNAAWARRYFDILRGIEPADVPSMVESLDRYIYSTEAVVAA